MDPKDRDRDVIAPLGTPGAAPAAATPSTASADADAPVAAAPVVAPAPPSLPLAAIGAALGAAAGGLLWFAVEYFLHFQVGWIAIGCGVAAGWVAAALGRGHAPAIGLLAAVFGALGVFGGSYASFRAQTSDAALRAEAAKVVPGYTEATSAEQDAFIAGVREAVDERGYVGFLMDDTKSLVWMVLFGAIGLYYGYRVGAGTPQPSA